MQPPTRVLIIAESDKEGRKLAEFFEQAPGFAVVGVNVSGDSGKLERKRFDVRIVKANRFETNISLEGKPTLYLVPQANVGLRTLAADEAVLSWDASAAQIRAAAMALAAGLQVARPAEAEPSGSESEFAFIEPLTDRELHILNLLADGLSNPEIARHLKISRNTAKFHVSSIIAKLGAASRTEAVTIGLRRGLIIL